MNRSLRLAIIIICSLLLAAPWVSAAEDIKTYTSHGMTQFGDLKYGPDFKHFEYVNPDAPKGGTLVISRLGSFDSFNRYIILGTAPFILAESLMVRSGDEQASLYGLIAESVTLPEDYSWVEFKLRDYARWHDGKPITVEDVLFTFELLKKHGRPEYRNTYSKITRVEKTGTLSVRFTFNEKGDKSNPYQIASLMPVLPKHYWETRDFTKPSLDASLASGPYRITKVDPGRSFTRERVKNYWGKDLPLNRGRYNFEIIRYDYYRDATVSYEAFIAGKIDLRIETLISQWVKGYNAQAVEDGHIIKKLFKTNGIRGYRSAMFNLHQRKFQDPKIREAMSYAYDFDWMNKTLFHGMYVRPKSYWESSELESKGLPEPGEIKYLEPYRDQIDPRVFTHEYNPASTKGTPEGLRNNLRIASRILRGAGCYIKDGKLFLKNGNHLEFEIMISNPGVAREYSSWTENLKLLGITAKIRIVDSTEMAKRIRDWDFDVSTGYFFPMGISPGTGLRQYYGSVNAGKKGSINQAGISNPVIDGLIEKIIAAPDRVSKIAAVKALDRVLLWNFYSVPLYYTSSNMVAYWNKFGQPEIDPKYLYIQPFFTADTWWIDKKKAEAF